METNHVIKKDTKMTLQQCESIFNFYINNIKYPDFKKKQILFMQIFKIVNDFQINQIQKY